jgi:arabinose-5-phosphate isomerase
MAVRRPIDDGSTSPALASAARTLEAERAGLDAVARALRGDLGRAFEAAVDAIRTGRGRVIVAGIGKSGHVGRKIAATLASTGTPAHFVHAAEAGHGDLGMIAAEDVVLALSWSGETTELAALIDYAARFGVKLIAMSSEPRSTLARSADIVLALPKAKEACPNGLAPTTSSLMQLALGDALAVALLEARGFTARDFRRFHPGGRLGAQLKLARDLMHTGDELPVVRSGAPIAAAIETISAKGFGASFVVGADGKLAGIVTDGDLRRALARGTTTGAVDAIMTRGPKTLPPDALAADVLALMNGAKITVVAIVEDGRPLGLVHMHDLLRAGVA